MNYLKVTDIEAYNIGFDLSNKVWNIVIEWSYLAQKTIGAQFIDAADSISANVAEGFGRYHKKDKIKFYHYSRGSTLESIDWLEKSMSRNLLSNGNYLLSYFKKHSPLRPQSGLSAPLSRERGKASQMRGVSQDKNTN